MANTRRKTSRRRSGSGRTQAAGSRAAVAAGRAIAEEVSRERRAALRRRERVIEDAKRTGRAAPGRRAATRFVERAGPRGIATLLAEGDSWFHFPGQDILSLLEDDHGYDVASVAHRGDTVEDMAYVAKQYGDFSRALEKLVRRGELPKAILLSGGGNDVAGEQFCLLLDHAASAAPGLNEDVVRGVIEVRVRNAYLSLLAAMTRLSVELTGEKIPILVHGYGHAVPDGRGFLGGWWILPGPWLRPGFVRKGFLDQRQNTATVAALIDRFNAMLQQVAAGFPNVRYVDLRSLLPNDAAYKSWWGDELHPTKKGFKLVAEAFATVIETL